MPRLRIRFWLTTFFAALLATCAISQTRSLTSADGRAIEAEILGYEGLDKVRIKRADTGQTFTLPITAFSEADQKILTEEAARPPVIHPGELRLELGRTRLATRRETRDLGTTSGGTARNALITTEDDWGYTVTLRSSTRHTLENLRAEYMLFVRVDTLKNTDERPGQRTQGGKMSFDPIAPSGLTTAKTEGITTRKTELKGNVKWVNTNDKRTQDTLHGIWIRIYRGDELLLESATPTYLADSVPWSPSTR